MESLAGTTYHKQQIERAKKRLPKDRKAVVKWQQKLAAVKVRRDEYSTKRGYDIALGITTGCLKRAIQDLRFDERVVAERIKPYRVADGNYVQWR